MNYLNILPLTSSLFCVALVVFVFFRGRKQPAAMFFLAGMASLAIVEFCNFAALGASSEDSLLMWKGLSLVGEALFVNSWLLFSILFGKENTRKTLAKWKWILPPLYILTAILLIKVLANQTLLTGDSNIIQLGTMGKFFNLSLLIIVIITLMYLESTFRSSAGQERWRIKYILFGIGAIISLYVYIFSQRILYSTIDITNIYIMSSVILVSNILILYSIVKTNVISGETYISRRVIYTSISLIAIGLYSITVAIFVHIVRLFDISRNLKIDILLIFSAILILIIAFYNESFRRKTKLIINRHFRKSKYVYRDEWMVFSSELSKKINTHEVCEVFIKNLSERLFVKHLSIWLVEDDNRTLSIVSSQHIDEINIKIRLVDRIIQYIYYKNQPVNISAIKANKELLPLTREVSILLDKTKAQLIVPLLLGQRWVGLLTLGKIQTGERFDEIEDYNLLKSVSAHAASAINNAMLFERRMEAKELEAFSRLSSFMMHDLKNATSMLDMVAQNAKQHLCNPEFQKDAIETISGAVARMKKMITNLSTIHAGGDRRILGDRRVIGDPSYDGPEKRRRHDPRLKDLDLNKVINDALNSLSMNNFAQVNIEKSFGHVSRVHGDVEEIYKVVHNLLLNAYEAVDGNGQIKVSTKTSDDYVICSVSDNGPGISSGFIQNSLFRPFKSTKETGLGIGLYQCKSIIDAHDGRIEVESEPGKGTTFTVYLPAQGAEDRSRKTEDSRKGYSS